MVVTTVADERVLLAERIRIFKGQIAAIKTDLSDPQYINGAIQRHLELIQYHQGEIDKLVYRQQNLDTLLDNALNHLRLMSQRLHVLHNHSQVTKLDKLRNELINLGIPSEMLQ